MTNVNIAELAKEHGADKLEFTFPARPLEHVFGFSFTSSDSTPVVVKATADETRVYRMLSENYKMYLRPIRDEFAPRDFYISDFESLMSEYPNRYSVTVRG